MVFDLRVSHWMRCLEGECCILRRTLNDSSKFQLHTISFDFLWGQCGSATRIPLAIVYVTTIGLTICTHTERGPNEFFPTYEFCRIYRMSNFVCKKVSLEPTTSHLRDLDDTRSMKTHAAKRIFEWTQFMLQWFVRFCRIYSMCSVWLETTFDSLLWSAMLLLTLLVSGIKSRGARQPCTIEHDCHFCDFL